MDFSLTEEQEMLKESVRNFAQKEIKPLIKEYDEKGEWPKELTAKLGEMGLLGIVIPAEYSGAGYSNVDYVIILEEISKVDPSVGLVVAAHNSLCSNHLNLFANEEQKKKYLTRLASGQTLGAWGLTEPGAGSDAAALKTRVKKRGIIGYSMVQKSSSPTPLWLRFQSSWLLQTQKRRKEEFPPSSWKKE